MKLTFLNRHGQVVNKTLKEVGTTWERMNNVRVDYVTKEEKEYLERYGLQTTIFNVANLRKYGYVQLPAHYVMVVLQHGAVDMRSKK